MPEMKDWKHDAEYISYVESGESAAVFYCLEILSIPLIQRGSGLM